MHARAQGGGNDARLQADAQQQLRGKQFRDVHVQVADGVVTLTGQVDRLSDKMDAEKRVQKTHEAASINNQIQVNVPAGISDQDLFSKMAKKLAYLREGYGTLPFDSISLQVKDGVATLGGEVVEPTDKEDALSIVEDTPGVRGIVDHLQVAPVSPMDWRLRRALYNAIYGAPQLNRYAMDPSKPIRIVVINGHVTLTGMVDNRSDQEIAGMRANTVPGVFSVQNDIQVAGQGPER